MQTRGRARTIVKVSSMISIIVLARGCALRGVGGVCDGAVHRKEDSDRITRAAAAAVKVVGNRSTRRLTITCLNRNRGGGGFGADEDGPGKKLAIGKGSINDRCL